MNAQDFCYWLQGFMEVQQPKELTPAQTQMVKDHLRLVFTKATPERGEVDRQPTPGFPGYTPERLC